MNHPKPPDDLAAAILRATSGPACGCARERLCDWVDGALDDVDRELVARHAGSCRRCDDLAGALRAMSADLPLLAEKDPGPGFTASVLAATSAPRRRPPLAARLAQGWQELMNRPRFAWEGAFIGAFIMALLFGSSSSPLAGIPQRALALASLNPVEEIREPVSHLEESVSMEVKEAWSATRSRVVTTSVNVAGKIRGSFTGLLTSLGPGGAREEHIQTTGTEPAEPAGRLSHREGSEEDSDDPNARARVNRNRPDGESR